MVKPLSDPFRNVAGKRGKQLIFLDNLSVDFLRADTRGHIGPHGTPLLLGQHLNFRFQRLCALLEALQFHHFFRGEAPRLQIQLYILDLLSDLRDFLLAALIFRPDSINRLLAAELYIGKLLIAHGDVLGPEGFKYLSGLFVQSVQLVKLPGKLFPLCADPADRRLELIL